MLNDDYLLQKLKDEVSSIKKETLQKYGFEPLVCTDDDLEAITSKHPHSLEEILGIGNLRNNLREEYAQRLVEAVKEFENPSKHSGDIVENKKSTVDILKDLSKKLTDLSKSNPMLAMMKLGSAHVDISGSGLDANSFSGTAEFDICIKSAKDGQQMYDSLSDVIRSVKSGQRDKGRNELYVAYPFVEGRLTGSDFGIRAPLILFPVSLSKSQSKIVLKADSSRDPIFNVNLALAALKFSGSPLDIGDNRISEYKGEDIIPLITEFYKKFFMELRFNGMEPIPFEECAPGTFDMFDEGTYNVKPYMVIGRFSNDSNSIQYDYKGITADPMIPKVIAELVGKVGMDDIYFEDKVEAECVDISEKDLYYINQLNSAQENILKAMDKESAFVIQGPPGTGKSQVITGLVASSIAQHKKILVVSEKKTALDVIRSRLGLIGSYVMMIDEPSNKDDFYAQIARMLKLPDIPKIIDTDQISDAIDKDVRRLSIIRDVIFAPMPDFRIEPYRLYELGRMFDFKDSNQWNEFSSIGKNVPPELMKLSFDNLTLLNRSLKDIDYVSREFELFKLMNACPWVSDLKSNLSEIDVNEMRDKVNDLRRLSDDVANAGILKKIAAKNRYSDALKAFTMKYIADGHTADSVTSCTDLLDAVSIYSKYSVRKNSLDSMPEDFQLYVRSIFDISKGDTAAALKANDDVYRYIITKHITDFDAAHPEVRSVIHDFESILIDVDLRMGDKMQATVSNIMNSLMMTISGLSSMKKDIESVLTSKNRWSISKFISRVSILDKIDVWLMTPEAVSDILPLNRGMFDLVVFDEASQMYVERAIPSIYRANKVIIAGDNKQLRPSALGSGRITFEEDSDDLDDVVAAALEQESLLDLARIMYRTYTLNFHYRSEYEELIAFSNNAFYNGELYVSPNVNEPDSAPIEYHNVGGVWEKTCNMAEGQAVVSLIKDIIKGRKDNETIGVITFNSQQRDLIFDLIEKESQADPSFAKALAAEMERKGKGNEDLGLFIKNIESVQGDERDIIIFSIGYAKGPDGKMMQRFGWLNQLGGENRLNVAISRAKKKIHIIASIDPEELSVEDTKNDGPKVLKEYLRYCKAVNDRDEESVRCILKRQLRMPDVISHTDQETMRMIKDLCGYLTDKGYRVKENVGVSGYNLALAVYDGNRVLMGIDADRSIYPRISSSRERDIHRIKYLEGRGWNICRVWVSEYWKDRDMEFERVLAKVKSAE